MDATKIIPQGEEAKFLIVIDHEGFDQVEDNFFVTLTWGMSGQSLTIKKADMIPGDEGTFYFTFATDDMLGKVTAECSYLIPDDNFADHFRTEVDRQILCFITPAAQPKLVFCPMDTEEHDVTYTRIDTSGEGLTYSQLLSVLNEPIITVDGLAIYVTGSAPKYLLTYTGAEVQELLDKINNL